MFLKDVCKSLKNEIQKNQDLEASLLSEGDFKAQNDVVDRLEELEAITTARLPVLSDEEVILNIQQICDSLDIKINLSEQTKCIIKKSRKCFLAIKFKLSEIKIEIEKTEDCLNRNIQDSNIIVSNQEILVSTMSDLQISKLEVEGSIQEVDGSIEVHQTKLEQDYLLGNSRVRLFANL